VGPIPLEISIQKKKKKRWHGMIFKSSYPKKIKIKTGMVRK
jgi:hypothetical protein